MQQEVGLGENPGEIGHLKQMHEGAIQITDDASFRVECYDGLAQ